MTVKLQKSDLKREFKELYRAKKDRPIEVEVPEFQYLMIDGSGDPSSSPRFQEAMGALYGLAYTTKFMMKSAPIAFDFVVMPLESLWWADDWSAFPEKRTDEWQWTMMIMLPPQVTQALFERAKSQLIQKKNPPLLNEVRLEALHEGSSVQILHVGPYHDVEHSVERVMTHIDSQGRPRGKYHEIYLSDPRRTAPERLKTIVRQPYTPTDSSATDCPS